MEESQKLVFPKVLLPCSDPIAGSGGSSGNFAPFQRRGFAKLGLPGPRAPSASKENDFGAQGWEWRCSPGCSVKVTRLRLPAGNYCAPTPGVKTGEGEIPGKQNKGKDESPEKSRLSLSEAEWMEGKF